MRRLRQRRSNKAAPIIDAMLDAPPTRQKQRIPLWLASLGSIAVVPSFTKFADSVATCALFGTAGGIYYEEDVEERNIQTTFIMLLFSTTILLHALSVLSSIIRIITAAHSTTSWLALLGAICCIIRGGLGLMNEPSTTRPTFDVIVMVGCITHLSFIYVTNVEREVGMCNMCKVGGSPPTEATTHTAARGGQVSQVRKMRATIKGMKRRASHLVRTSISVPSPAMSQTGKETSSASVAALRHAGGVRILCFDGGGNRIVVALWILEHIESIMGTSSWLNAYDYIGGISAGGVVAILSSDQEMLKTALTNQLKRPCRNWAEDMRKVVFKMLSTGFSTIRIWRLICQGHMIDLKKTNKIASQLFTNQSFKHQPGKAHAMVLTTRLNDNKDLVEHVVANYPVPTTPRLPQLDEYIDQVLVGHPYERSMGWTRCEATLATICVPVICPPLIRQMCLPPESPIGPHRFHDGGLIRNMPAAHCVAEATKLWPGVPIGCVHSFGTGSGGHQKGAKKSALAWLIALATPRNDEDSRFTLLKALMPRLEELRQESQNLMMPGVLKVDQPPPRPPSMIRINVDGDLAERFKLNVTKADDIEAMRRATLQYVADNSELIDRVVKDMLS